MQKIKEIKSLLFEKINKNKKKTLAKLTNKNVEKTLLKLELKRKILKQKTSEL